MVIYYLIFILLSAFALINLSSKNDYWRPVIFFFSCLVLIGMAGLAGNVSRDYLNYQYYYDSIQFDTRYHHWDIENPYAETFYLRLGQLFSLVFPFQVYLIFIVGLAVLLNVSAFYKMSPYPALSVLIYYAHNFIGKEMTQIRAGLASAIILMAIYWYTKAKNTWLMYGLLILAFLFHNGAGIAILCFMLWQLNLKQKWYPWILGASMIFGFFFPLGSFIKFASSLHPIFFRIYNYTAWGEYAQPLGILTNPFTIKQILVLAICWKYKERLQAMVPAFNLLFFFYLCATCWLILFNDFAIFSARIATFLSVGDPILIAMITACFVETKWREVAFLSAMFFAFALFFINIQLKGILAPYELFNRFLLETMF